MEVDNGNVLYGGDEEDVEGYSQDNEENISNDG